MKNWTEAEYEEFKQRQAAKHIKKIRNRSSIPFADVEPVAGYESMGAQEVPRLDSLCSIAIHSIRKRLADADGISGKAAIDGLVHAGILADDSTKEVKEVRFSQEQGKIEKTIITITW